MAGLELKGMEELMDKIEALGGAGSKIENQALLKAAKPILDDAVATVVFKDRSTDLRKGLKISRPKKKGDTKYVLVGIDKGDISEIFYGKMVEWGTSKMAARPFLAPAYERNKSEAIDIIKEEFRKGLGL